MAFKIVNGKLVLITDQSDFGTPEQKAAGKKITGTLGNITKSPTAPTITPTPQQITLGSAAPAVAPPPAPTIQAGGNLQQILPQQTGGQGALLSPVAPPPPPITNLQPLRPTTLGFQPLLRPLSAGPAFDAPPTLATPRPVATAIQNLFGNPPPQRRPDQGDNLTATIEAQEAREAQVFNANQRFFSASELARFQTLGNPRTVGEFEAVGGLPTIQAAIQAFLRGEEVNTAFIRFAINQGLIEEDIFGLDLDAAGAGAGGVGSGGGTSRGPRTRTQLPGSRVPGRSFVSGGLINWRI
jgi:hypothetical protein